MSDDRTPDEGAIDDPVARLPAPGLSARRLMAAHLREQHGIASFSVERHVHLGGSRPTSQHLTWDPGRASFHCNLCPGVSFSTGEITEQMVERAMLFDQHLQPHLVGLAGAEREEMARRYLAGDLNRERLRQLAGADARRRAAAGSRPSVEHRRRSVQRWLLERVGERGVLERVLDEAETLQRNDPAGWGALAERPLSRETLRDYWQDIPPPERQQAFAAGRKRASR